VLGNKALTDKATTLDAYAAMIRARLDKVPLVQNVDPLADAIGKLVHLPSEVAAAWQKASVVIVVEMLIACALMAFELLGNQTKPTTREVEPAAPAPQRHDKVVPMVSPKAAFPGADAVQKAEGNTHGHDIASA
jgi:hypothetical protein